MKIESYKKRNLLSEMKTVMKEHEKTSDDIIYIGHESTGERCTWEEFKAMADKDYLEGHGARKVRKDLVVIFSDGSRFYRHVYDSLGEWKFVPKFKMPKESSKIESFFCVPDDEIMLDSWEKEAFKEWASDNDKEAFKDL